MSDQTAEMQNSLDILADLIKIARRKGAETADAVRLQGSSV